MDAGGNSRIRPVDEAAGNSRVRPVDEAAGIGRVRPVDETVGNGRLSATLAMRRRAMAADLIEQAALELFTVRPMDEVTVEQIAAAAGVSVRSFYRYYPGKEMILTALPVRLATAIAEETARRPPTEAPFAALRNAVDTLTEETNDYLRRWQRAMAHSYGNERVQQLVVTVTSPMLTEALAGRAGLPADDLWPELAGISAATALVVGSRRWAARRGSLRAHLLDALDLLGRGLGSGPAPDVAATPGRG
ncbi:Putative TetR-family transcriptional regulator [Frankia alni ACN14a]|uniref:TetR-family transcriptional regulator n=1 Tax=Frankia alni (strain DSM 45986 / CECT 9034 / ACN14a) TaxID=326424 RepID=Q0RK86_FRAAA|nr:Putative TetR-family transcriptional regulator [Frankia alni ACN14a]